MLENYKSKNSLQNFWDEVQQSGIKIKWFRSETTTRERVKDAIDFTFISRGANVIPIRFSLVFHMTLEQGSIFFCIPPSDFYFGGFWRDGGISVCVPRAKCKGDPTMQDYFAT